MSASRRARNLLFVLVGGHLLIACLAGYIELAWGRFGWSSRIWGTLIPLTMVTLAAFAADAGLLGAWAVLAPFGRRARWLSAAFCTVCWAFGFLGQSPRGFVHELFWRYGFFEWQWPSFSQVLLYTSIAGLATLVVLGTALGLTVAVRRGVRLRRLADDELSRERGSRQFEISHLLLLVFVLSLLFAFCANMRACFSAQISMWWRLPADAPVYCAETVLVTALIWIVISFTMVWAVLSLGRPWLRLALVWIASAALGLFWALTFTAPQHHEHLFFNALFATGGALTQALCATAALLYVRRRGYRLMREDNTR